jgi:peptidoglycan hydrolase CwlO-like protein
VTAEVRDLQQRYTGIELRLDALEARIGAIEGRLAAQDERITRMLALLIRLAEQIEETPA